MLLRRVWPALLALALVATPGSQAAYRAQAQMAPGGLVLARYTDAGLVFLTQTGRDPASTRSLGTLPTMKAPATPADRVDDLPRGSSRGLCAPLDISFVVCRQGGQILPFDLARGQPAAAIDLPAADNPRITLYPSWHRGLVYVVETIGDPFGPAPTQPRYRLGAVTVLPQPTYTPLGSGETFRGIEIVGDTGDLRNLIYAVPLGGDPGRGGMWLLDRDTGAKRGEVWANGDRERGYLGYGPMAVSPDGRWLLVGSGPPVDGSDLPRGQLLRYDLDNPAPPRRGVVFPREVEPTGILWAPDGTALVTAMRPSWQPAATGPGGVFRVDPAGGAVTELAETSADYALPAALSPDAAWLVVDAFPTIGDNTLTTRSEAIALNAPPGTPADRYPVGADGDRVIGWFQLP